jgi:AraC family transcriptional regulator
MAADGCNRAAQHDQPTPCGPSPGLKPQALQRVLAYIDSHLGERFTLEQLASVVSVSRFHFARQFRCSTGLSPMAFLLQARVDRARQLLLRDASTIAETAAELGFFDQSHFTRTFRRLTGRTPLQFARARKPGAITATARLHG